MSSAIAESLLREITKGDPMAPSTDFLPKALSDWQLKLLRDDVNKILRVSLTKIPVAATKAH